MSPVTKLAMVIPLLCLLSLVTKYMINRHDQVQIPLPRTTGGLKKTMHEGFCSAIVSCVYNFISGYSINLK